MKPFIFNSSCLIYFIITLILTIKYTNTLFLSSSKTHWHTRSHQMITTHLSSSVNMEDIGKQQFNLGKIAFSLVPLSPESVGRRKTILKEIVPGRIWTLDQVQGIINVNGKIVYNLKL